MATRAKGKRTAKQAEDKYCTKCEKIKRSTEFYSTNAAFNSLDGRLNVCKVCLSKMIDENDINTIKSVLRQIDKPFLPMVWKTSQESKQDTFGNYMRQINSLKQYKGMKWIDGLMESGSKEEDSLNEIEELKPENFVPSSVVEQRVNEDFISPLDIFKLTPQLQLKWGVNFKKEQIYYMEQLWVDMIEGFIIETPSQKDYLKKCCITSVMANDAYSNSDIASGDKLTKSYNDLMKAANFAPSTRNSADKTGGVNSFSELFEVIEKDGFIPMWPNLDNDIADKTLEHLKKWTRELVMGDPNLATLVETQLNKMNREPSKQDEPIDSEYVETEEDDIG